MSTAAVTPDETSVHWGSILLAAAWFASTLAVRAPWVPFGSSLGYAAAISLMAVAVGSQLPRRRSHLAELLHEHAPATLAAGLLLGTHLASVLLMSAGKPALLQSLRLAGVLLFGLVFLVAQRQPGLRQALATAGATLVLLQVALRLLALAWPAVDEIVVARAYHQSLGAMPRFVGLSTRPSSAGLFTLMGVALAQGIGSKRFRAVITVLGLAMVAATMSIFLVLIPAVVGIALLRRPTARRLVAVVVVAGALAALWVHPLRVSFGARHMELGHLHPSWHHNGLGPKHMPVRRWAVANVAFELNETVYPIMARRALSCFWEHPAMGVGPLGFPRFCPVTTMNTYGQWSDARIAHNQYLGWLAELGLLGAAGALGALGLIMRAYRLQATGRWRKGVLLAVAFSGMLGPMVLALPSAAFLAVQLRRVG